MIKVTVGDLGKIITGKTPPTKDRDNYGGDIPFITPVDMTGNRNVFLTDRYLSLKGLNTVKNCYLPEHSICVSCIGSDMGKAVITVKPSVTNQQINSIIVYEDSFDYLYVYYLMRTLEGKIKSLGKNATAVPILNKSKFSNIEVSIIENKERQKAVSSILSAYDDLIENNQKQIKLLEEAAQRLYKEWFVDLRFPGYENTPIVDGVPEGWVKKKVTDILKIRYGKDHKNLVDGSIPVYGSGGIMRKVKQILYSGESVLIPRKGSLNNIFYVDGDFWTIDTMFYSIPLVEKIAKYAYLFLSRLDMYSFNIGAAVPSMTVNILDGIDILLPDKDTIAAFDDLSSVLFNRIKLLNKQCEKASEARDRLLPKLMSGEIEV